MLGCTAQRGLACACRSLAELSLELCPVIPHLPGHTGKTWTLFLCNDSLALSWSTPQTLVLVCSWGPLWPHSSVQQHSDHAWDCLDPCFWGKVLFRTCSALLHFSPTWRTQTALLPLVFAISTIFGIPTRLVEDLGGLLLSVLCHSGILGLSLAWINPTAPLFHFKLRGFGRVPWSVLTCCWSPSSCWDLYHFLTWLLSMTSETNLASSILTFLCSLQCSGGLESIFGLT